MPHSALDSLRPLESCTFQLHRWKPFHSPSTGPQTLDLDPCTPVPYPTGGGTDGVGGGMIHCKRPCLSDRATSFSGECLDISRLSLFDEDRPPAAPCKRCSLRWVPRKRRRRGSRSVSGRSSDRSGTRRCCSVGASAAYATCSDFPMATGPGTDSSGELFLHGDGHWAMEVIEGKGGPRKERGGEKETPPSGHWQIGNFDVLGNESGYGSEPGYRGDAEFGYGDEVEEEEDDPRPLFWDKRIGDVNMGIVGKNMFSEQKVHHRGRRKKQDWKLIDEMR